MPGTLINPIEIQPATVASAKIAAFKVECNVERWVEVWITYGDDPLGTWEEYSNKQLNAVIPPTYIKLEDGSHPLAPGQALRRCPLCRKWFGLETVCDKPDCEGAALEPYPALSGFCSYDTGETTPYLVLQTALYEYLMTEVVPDPVTGEERPILPVTEWHP